MFRRLILVSCVVIAAGCGDLGPIGGARDRSAAHREQVHGLALTIALDGKPATTFRTSTAGEGVSPLKRRIEQNFGSVVVDPRLSRAAEAYATAAEESDVELPVSFTEFVLHWAGCPDPTAAISTLLTDSDDEQVLIDHLASILGGDGYTHLGVARCEARGYRWRWQIILVSRSFAMKAVPAQVEPGTSIPIMFKVDPRYQKATLYATQPRGAIKQHPVGLSRSWAVTSVMAADEIGRMWIELLAEGEKGPEVIALFPVEVGRRRSGVWAGATNDDESWINDPNKAIEHMAALVNGDRRANGLEALTLDERLNTIAHSHSAEMANKDYFAHISPSTGDISDRLRRHGYLATVAMENLARAPSLGEAQEGLMKSPGHRSALLSPEVTHLGVGIVGDSGNPPMFIVTQLFAKPWMVPSTAGFLRDFESTIRDHRNRSLLSTRIDSRLQRAARAVADRVAAEGLDARPLSDLVEPELARIGLGSEAWRVAAGSATSIEDLEMPACVHVTDMETFGLAAVDSRTPEGVPFLIFVVLVME